VARYKDEIYNMPFNMNTFSRMWNVKTPAEAKAKIAEQIKEAGITEPKNLEEQAISLVGKDIYEKLVKGYTQKQWGRKCTELPAFIIKRLPVRFVHDNNYFNDRFQGIPMGGFNKLIDGMLEGVDVITNLDFFDCDRSFDETQDVYNVQCSMFNVQCSKILYTGKLDEYFDYRFGKLEYRTVRFEEEILDIPNYQGNAVVNYTEREIPYTRIIEHKHFEFGDQPETVITREYPAEWKPGMEPFYPVNDEKNSGLYERYRRMAEKVPDVIFGGRLGDYRYYDMDQVIAQALTLADMES
jgi:UDP-galactopyranose mutase